jgi:hypothetical protein
MSQDEITQGMWDRMPRAVRQHIENLNRGVAERDKLIRELRTIGSIDTEKGVIVDPYSTYPIVFHEDNNVRFWVEPGTFYIDVRIAHRRVGAGRPPFLSIAGGGHRCPGFIGMRPNSGNTMEVFKEGR